MSNKLMKSLTIATAATAALVAQGAAADEVVATETQTSAIRTENTATNAVTAEQVAAAKQTADTANTAVTAQEAIVADANSAKQTAQEAENQANQNLATAQTLAQNATPEAMAAADTAISQAEQAVQTAEETAKNAEHSVSSAQATVQEKQAQATTAQETADKAQVETDTAKAKVDELKATDESVLIENAQEVVTSAKNDVTSKEAAVETAETNLETAKETDAQLVTNTNQAKTELDAARTTLGIAQENQEKAQIQVEQAQKEVEKVSQNLSAIEAKATTYTLDIRELPADIKEAYKKVIKDDYKLETIMSVRESLMEFEARNETIIDEANNKWISRTPDELVGTVTTTDTTKYDINNLPEDILLFINQYMVDYINAVRQELGVTKKLVVNEYMVEQAVLRANLYEDKDLGTLADEYLQFHDYELINEAYKQSQASQDGIPYSSIEIMATFNPEERGPEYAPNWARSQARKEASEKYKSGSFNNSAEYAAWAKEKADFQKALEERYTAIYEANVTDPHFTLEQLMTEARKAVQMWSFRDAYNMAGPNRSLGHQKSIITSDSYGFSTYYNPKTRTVRFVGAGFNESKYDYDGKYSNFTAIDSTKPHYGNLDGTPSYYDYTATDSKGSTWLFTKDEYDAIINNTLYKTYKAKEVQPSSNTNTSILETALKEAQSVVSKVNSELISATNQVASAQSEVTKAQAKYDKLLATPKQTAYAQDKLTQAQEELTKAQETLATAEQDLQALLTNENSKADALSKAEEAYNQVAQKANQLQANASQAQEEVEQAQSALDIATAALQKAQTDLAKAKSAVEEAKAHKASLVDAQSNLAKAQEALSDAKSAREVAETKYAEETSKLDELKAVYDVADSRYIELLNLYNLTQAADTPVNTKPTTPTASGETRPKPSPVNEGDATQPAEPSEVATEIEPVDPGLVKTDTEQTVSLKPIAEQGHGVEAGPSLIPTKLDPATHQVTATPSGVMVKEDGQVTYSRVAKAQALPETGEATGALATVFGLVSLGLGLTAVKKRPKGY